jgi:hypothetical protein
MNQELGDEFISIKDLKSDSVVISTDSDGHRRSGEIRKDEL